MVLSPGLFGLGGVGGLHDELEVVAGGENLGEDLADALLGEGVQGRLTVGVGIAAVLEVLLDVVAPVGVVDAALGQVLLQRAGLQSK